MSNMNLQTSFPRLYRLSTKKEGAIADFWNPQTESWLLHLRRNLKDDEVDEWATLSHLLHPLTHIETIGHGHYKKTDYFRLSLLLVPDPPLLAGSTDFTKPYLVWLDPKKGHYYLGAHTQHHQHK